MNNRLLIVFVLGLIVGLVLRDRLGDTTTRARYDAVRASERDGIDSMGVDLGDL